VHRRFLSDHAKRPSVLCLGAVLVGAARPLAAILAGLL
jgi:hypothetical protein